MMDDGMMGRWDDEMMRYILSMIALIYILRVRQQHGNRSEHAVSPLQRAKDPSVRPLQRCDEVMR
jgi:hypothetical protein